MTPKELKALVKTLRSLGVTSYDDGNGVKLMLSAEAPVKHKKPKITSEEEKEIKHKVEELTSLMRMDDNSLVDRLFPDHKFEEANEDQH